MIGTALRSASVFAWHRAPLLGGFGAIALVAGLASASPGRVIEFYNTTLDNYFITGDPIEAGAIDGGAAGPGWSRTGARFGAGGPTSVCRFYGSISPGPNSHFYTAVDDECTALKALQVSTPATQKRWNFESLDFATTVAPASGCPVGTTPVYRAYNNGFSKGIDSNHRITSIAAGIQEVVNRGWKNEGVAMCAPPLSPEAGWWWNPAENGRWFFVESQNNMAEMAAYFYASNGRATWLTAGGANADPYAYTGALLGYHDGQTLFGDYRPPIGPTDAGAVSLRFSDETHGTIGWAGGGTPVERKSFGNGTAPFQPDTGWWWNSSESGREYGIEVQGDSIFIVAYLYDDSGNPVWYLSSGRMASPTGYQGPLLQFANGQTLTGPYQAPSTPQAVGQLSIEFTAIDEAMLTFTDDVAPVAAAAPLKTSRSRIFSVARKQPVKPSYVLPARYDGSFHQKNVLDFASSGLHQIHTTTVSGNLTWAVDPLLDALMLRQPASTYVLQAFEGTKPISMTYEINDSGAGSVCTGKVTETYPVQDHGSFLDVNGFAQYVGHVELEIMHSSIHVTCDTDTPSHDEFDIPLLISLSFDFKGNTLVYGITGVHDPRHPVGTPQITITEDWSFASVNAN